MFEPTKPYRQERALDEIIRPDTRMRDRIVLVFVSASIGAAVASVSTLVMMRSLRAESPAVPAVTVQPVTIRAAPVAPAVHTYVSEPTPQSTARGARDRNPSARWNAGGGGNVDPAAHM